MSKRQKLVGMRRGSVICLGGGRYCNSEVAPRVPRWLSSVMLSDIVGLTCRRAEAFDDHTRKELKHDSKMLAKALLAMGIKRGDYVLIMDNFYPCICMVYAAMRVGAVAVPFAEDASEEILKKFMMGLENDTFLLALNWTKEQAERFCENTAYKCKSVVSINTKRFQTREIKLGQKYYDYREIKTIAKMGRKHLPIPWSRGETVMLGSSSGTSGEAKFFSYTDQHIITSVLSSQKAFAMSLFERREHVWAAIVPRQRPYGLLNSALLPSWGRRKVRMMHEDDTVDDIFREADVICCAADFADIVLAELTIRGDELMVDGHEKTVTLVVGGAFLSAEKSEELRSFLSRKGFRAIIRQGYGISEAVGCMSVVARGDYCPDTVGKLAPGVKIWLKKDDGGAYKLGDVGRVWVSGETVIKSYGNEALDRKNIIEDDDGEIWVDTGDYMSLYKNGYLRFHYSEKEFYFAKTHEKIYPRRAEEVIERISGVARCWVMGDVERAISVAFVAPEKEIDSIVLKETIQREVKTTETPQHELLGELEIPKYYVMVKEEELAVDKAGKRQKTVKDRLWEKVKFEDLDELEVNARDSKNVG